MINNAPYSFLLMTLRCHMLILTLSLAFFMTLMQNVEIFQKWPSRGVKYTNTLEWPLTTPHQLNWYSTWLTTLKICFMTQQNTLRSNQQHLPHTKFLILRKMQSNYPVPMQTFFVTFWCNYYTCQREHIQTYIWKCHSYSLGWKILIMIIKRRFQGWLK